MVKKYSCPKHNRLNSRPVLPPRNYSSFSLTLFDYRSSAAQALIASERKRSARISGPVHLSSVDYSINADVVEPTAVFRFGAASDVDGCSDFNVEMNVDQLFSFYQQLELVQMKLDALK